MAGEILKKRREELGENLKEIAHSLKIRYDYLKAIEDEEFERLPVEVYAKGYIKDYARYLNIDPEIIIKAYILKTFPPVTEKTPPVEAIGKKKQWIKYLLAFIVILAAVVAYTLFISPPSSEKSKITPSEKATSVVQPAKPVLPAVQPSLPTTEQEKEEIIKQPIEEKKIEKAMKEHALEIRASETTWLLVKIDDTESKDMLLKKGESIQFSAKQSFSLKIGNAGGIKLIFDGKDAGILGEQGQVITLNLPENKNSDPDKLKEN